MSSQPLLQSVRLDGKLLTDVESLQRVKTDLGGLLSEVPVAVLPPGSAADVAAMMREAAAAQIPVTIRGTARSVYGQTVALPGGVVIDMTSLNSVHAVGQDRVTADAGATWSAVVKAALAHGLVPPVLTDYLDITVGGTLSWGGLGLTSWRYGLQVDNVLEIEVVTADGAIRRCSPDCEPDLFHAVLGGMGLVGVMTRVTLRLIPAPGRAIRVQIPYADAAAMNADQLRLAQEERIDTVQGIVAAPEGRWACMMEIVQFYDGERPDPARMCEGLNGAVEQARIIDTDFETFLFRYAGLSALPCLGPVTPHAHPWWSTMASPELAPRLINRLVSVLDPAKATQFDLIITYPMRADRSRTPLPSLPDLDWFFAVANFWCVDYEDRQEIADVLSENRRLFERAAADHLQGSADPIAAVDYSRIEWMAHFAKAWPAFHAAKRKFDPQGILDKTRKIF